MGVRETVTTIATARKALCVAQTTAATSTRMPFQLRTVAMPLEEHNLALYSDSYTQTHLIFTYFLFHIKMTVRVTYYIFSKKGLTKITLSNWFDTLPNSSYVIMYLFQLTSCPNCSFYVKRESCALKMCVYV